MSIFGNPEDQKSPCLVNRLLFFNIVNETLQRYPPLQCKRVFSDRDQKLVMEESCYNLFYKNVIALWRAEQRMFSKIDSKQRIVKKCTFHNVLCWPVVARQCDQIWRNFANLAKIKKSLAIFQKVYLLFGKVVKPLWGYLYAFG